MVNVSPSTVASLRSAGVSVALLPESSSPPGDASSAEIIVVDAARTDVLSRSSVLPMLAIAHGPAEGLMALSLGADGIVDDRDGVDQVVRALGVVRSGGTFISDVFLASLVDELRMLRTARAAESTAHTPLSSREIEVVLGVARGQNNGEIAGELQLSPKTVKNHISNCLVKLGMANRTQLAVYAVNSGLYVESPRPASQPRDADWSAEQSPPRSTQRVA
jgi:DNA-binding NarL/FixJ family response regulator